MSSMKQRETRPYDRTEIAAPLPPKVEQAADNLKWCGRIGFWTQLVLGIISAVTVLFASLSLGDNSRTATQGTEFGILCAILGIIVLVVAMYFAWRYMAISRLLRSPNPDQRPSKPDTLQVIRLGLTVNMVGMLIAIIGAETIAGIVLAKSLALPPNAISAQDLSRFVNSLDLLIVQANTNSIAAHFAGIVSSLVLLNRITR